MKKKILCTISFTLFGLCLFLSSCKKINMPEVDLGLGNDDIPNWTITINEIVKYPRASLGEKEVQAFDGRPIWIRKHYEFSSKSIKDIEAIPLEDNPGFYKLRMILDKHGSLVAMRLCNDPSHDPWALLVNGVYYRSLDFHNSALNNEYTEIELKGPFDRSIAEFLEKYAADNYEYYHEDD